VNQRILAMRDQRKDTKPEISNKYTISLQQTWTLLLPKLEKFKENQPLVAQCIFSYHTNINKFGQTKC